MDAPTAQSPLKTNHNPTNPLAMCLVVGYLIAWLLLLGNAIFLLLEPGTVPIWLDALRLPFFCAIMGGIAGAFYCLWAVYVHWCRLSDWNQVWVPWYLIRPILSLISGALVFVLLKAGILFFQQDGNNQEISNNMVFLALAFLAGFHLEYFIRKLDEIAAGMFKYPPLYGNKDKQ